jgi:ribose-phosphate pyrophosphokinase
MPNTVKINGRGQSVKSWTFPGGERNVRLEDDKFWKPGAVASITCDYKGSDDLVDLILLVNALRHGGISKISLNIPYFPFARQDRVMVGGEAHALQAVVQVINMLNFTQVFCKDPHSDVLEALLTPGTLVVEHQWEIWQSIQGTTAPKAVAALVSPDAGALKKIYKLANILKWPVITASKKRDVTTGQILSTSLDCEYLTGYDELYIIDDICDGGRTFIELAKVIRNRGFLGKLVLCVTHGIFSNGLTPEFDIFDKIYCENNINDTELYAFNIKER